MTVVLSHQRGLEMLREFCRAPFSYFRVCLVRVGFERLIFVGVWSTTGWTVNCVEAPCPVSGAGCWSLIISMLQLKYWKNLKDCLVLLKLWQVYWLQQRKWRSFHSLPQSIMDSSESRWPSFRISRRGCLYIDSLKYIFTSYIYIYILVFIYIYRDVIYTFHFSLALLMAGSHPTPCL